jgi:hypothetical protein
MFGKKPHQENAAVYVDRKGETAIVVSMHYNGAGGFLFEDDSPAVVAITGEPEDLGTVLLRALRACEIRTKSSQRDRKLTDWPAFRCSGRNTVKKFESDFIHLHVHGTSEANVTYVVEGWPAKDAELRAVANASGHSPAQLGERCILVWRACRDRVL